jgi:hypothetical protein
VTTVFLSIDPQMVGPVSVDTVEVIRLIRIYAHLDLAEAKDLVDRCVFHRETVRVPIPSSSDAAALVDALAKLPAPPRIRALIPE